MERMEKRELLATDLASIGGTAFVDQDGDGLQGVGEPHVVVNGSGNLVAPGTAGEQGIEIRLHEDTNGNEVFDAGTDLLIGTTFTDVADGSYRFDISSITSTGLVEGAYFVLQPVIPEVTAVTVVNASGQRFTDSGGTDFPDITATPPPQTGGGVSVDAAAADGVRTELIDDYSVTSVTLVANNPASSPFFTSNDATEAIGGNRDIEIVLTNGVITYNVDPTSGIQSIGASGGGLGTTNIQYDGIVDQTATLDATGLGGVSLAGRAPGQGFDPMAGLIVSVRATDSPGETLTITVHTDGTDSSSAVVNIPQAADFSNPAVTEVFVRFADFVTSSGAGADFNNVGAIEATVPITVADNDVVVSIVEARQQELVEANLANIVPITLGGELFLDTFSAGQNNGFREGTEAGITGVTVQLHQLANANDTVDPATSVALATTTTGANGAYSFAGLDPGHYAVVVPASQFQSGAVLFGFANSTGNDPAPDPDNDVDGDDNGTTLTSTDVISGTITLASNTEPINDDDTDPNTNTTLDLGFFPQIDLSISKTLNAASSSLVAGGNAVFDIVVQNFGPLTANDIEVEDIFPSGFTFTGLQGGSFTTSQNGQTVTVDVGSLPSGGQASFQLTADIAANATQDVTNTATVTATEVDTDTSNNSDDEFLDLIESDLRISKQDAPDPVNAGDQLTYTIIVTNDGPDTASGVQVTDPLPAGVDFASGDVDGNSNLVVFDAGTRTVTASVGTLANAATSTITITVDVDPDASSPLNNAATVTLSPNTDPDASNNSASADTTVERVVDVGVTKAVTGTPIAGQSITYTIDVTNAGPSQARGISVTDTLDANLTFDAASFNGGTAGVTFTQNGQDLTFDVGTLDPSVTASFSFDVDIASSATGNIDNVATVTTTDTDSNAANDTGNVVIAVQQQIDLILTKDVDLATAVPGQDQLVYTFDITHDTDSSSDATNVVLTDTLPAGVVGAVINAPNATSTNFDTNTNTVTVEFASIPVTSSETFTVTVDTDPAATGTVTNTGTITADGTDIDSSNNTDDAVTVLTPDFDITISKAVDNASPGPTESITYTIDLTNTGPSTAPGIVLSDDIPTGLTFVSGTLNGSSPTITGSTLSFPAITLTPSGTAQATLNFTVDASSTGTITNTASTNDLSASGENNVNNNTATADITVIPLVDLEIDKSVSATAAQAGDNLTYTIDVTNNGPSEAQGVTVTDTLPSGLNFVSGTGPNNATLTESNGVVSFAAGSLASGASFQMTIIVSIPAGTSGDHVNSVSVTTTTNENITTNNSDSVTTNVDPLTSSISGVVYIDENNNGIQDAGEDPFPGVTVTLTGTDALGNAVNATATTDANGAYQFANLAAGTYIVTQTQPVGFRDGIETAGVGATASVADNVFSNLVLGQATTATAFNFGELGQPLSKRRFLASTT